MRGTGEFACRAAAAFLGALAGTFLWTPQAAAGPVEDRTAGWYTVEAIVFQRTQVSQSDTGEQLSDIDPRSVPADIRSLDADSGTAGYSLSPLALATLEFPTLSYDCSAAEDAGPYRPAGVPAWYQPAFPDAGAQSVGRGTDMAPADENEPIGPGETPVAGPPFAAFANDACRPALPGARDSGGEAPDAGRSDAFGPAGAAGDDCPPAPLDIPLAPGRSPPVCSLPPGQPPPRIEPALEPHPLLDWLSAARRFETGLRERSYQAGTNGAALRREANRIRNAADLRLVWHGRWTQPVPPRDSPEPLLLQAGRQAEGVHELEGTFAVTLGRYLHFHARLWWVSPPRARPIHVGDPRSVLDGPRTPPELRLPPHNIVHMALEESRVMRSGTLHYLDHPVLGVLVQADPVAPPGWLLDASAALESAKGGD